MQLKLHWHDSLKLHSSPYQVDKDELPIFSGIYIFFRTYGEYSEALYVGQAMNIKTRIVQQLNNLKLMNGIKNAPKGNRRLVFARFIAGQGQKTNTALNLCEKALIRYYLDRGDNLLNVKGTQLKFHEIDSVRHELKNFLPLKTALPY